jgi:hypothetical protein
MDIRIFIFISILFSCNQGESEIVIPKNIKALKIFNSHGKADTMTISDAENINKIITQINISQSEPIKFSSITSILVVYSDGTEVMILSSGTAAKINGKSFRLQKSINDMILSLNSSN